jgi:hypothetical protein
MYASMNMRQLADTLGQQQVLGVRNPVFTIVDGAKIKSESSMTFFWSHLRLPGEIDEGVAFDSGHPRKKFEVLEHKSKSGSWDLPPHSP